MDTIRAVVFDLDGTLVDSLADIAHAVNSTLESRGREPHSIAAYRGMVGWGLKKLLVAATVSKPFSEKELNEAHEQVVTLYHADPVHRTTVYDGISPLLAGLSGVPLAVLSNKEESVAHRIIETLFPGVFAAVLGSRPDRPSKPDAAALLALLQSWFIEPAECALLGDSGIDIETAVRAGAVPCGALWGYRDAAELTQAGAAAVFARPADFARWLSGRVPSTVREGVT